MSVSRVLGRLPFSIAVLACAALALPAASSAATSCPDADLQLASSSFSRGRAATLCLINGERTSRGLAPLSSSRHLLKAAQRYSRLMVRERFFSHVSPSGSTLAGRVRRQTSYLRGARRWALAENIAWGTGALATPARIVAAWMKSSGHRANILRPGFRDIGIGIADGAPGPGHGRAAATYTTDFGHRS